MNDQELPPEGGKDAPIVVRPARGDDLAHPNVGGASGEYREQLAHVLRSARDRLLLAEVGGNVVGRITLEIDDEHIEVFGLVVAPDVRRRGVASTLMNTAESLAGDLGCAHVRLTVSKENRIAQHLYKRRGYRVVGDDLSRGLASASGEVIHEREPVWKMEKPVGWATS